MRSITVLRVEADSGVVGRALGKLPGVEVVETLPVEEPEPAATDDGSPPSPPVDESEASDGLLSGVAPDTDLGESVPPSTGGDEGAPSMVRQYGLLGAGVTLVLAGLASVGVWVYQRRGGDGAETPPPSASVEPEPRVGETPSPSGETDEAEPVSPVTESTAEEREQPAGRVEGDRSDVEWTTRDRVETRTEFDADTGAETASETDAEMPDQGDDVEPGEPRPGESMDPAPLLGVAFIALSGALVRWLRSGDDGEQGPTG